MELTDTERKCLRAVHLAGSAVLQKHGFDIKALAAGEFLPHNAGTLLLLVGKGVLEFEPGNHRRLRPTAAGIEAAGRVQPAGARRDR